MKSIEEIREALRLFDPYSSDPKYLFTLRAALDELAALRETNAETEKRLLAFIEENCELRRKVRQLESGGKLVGANGEPLVLVSELQRLREENAKLREAIKKRDEGGHQPFCPTWHGRECNCFPPEWNALVRGMQ